MKDEVKAKLAPASGGSARLVRPVKRALIVLAIADPLCIASAQDVSRLWTAPEPLTFDGLRAWYAAGGLPGQRWPRERYLDLNGDGPPEVFLGIEDYSRGMGYALFTHHPEGWVLIADRVEGTFRLAARIAQWLARFPHVA